MPAAQPDQRVEAVVLPVAAQAAAGPLTAGARCRLLPLQVLICFCFGLLQRYFSLSISRVVVRVNFMKLPRLRKKRSQLSGERQSMVT